MTDPADLLPAPDPVRENLLAARAPDALLEEWRAATRAAGALDVELLEAAAIHTHYKPGLRGRLVFEGRIRRGGREPMPRYLFLQVYRDGDGARRRYAAAVGRKSALRSVGPSVFLVARWNAVVWVLPNGPRLRGLRSFLQKKALRRFLARTDRRLVPGEKLSRPKLMRYVPRRRALLRWKRRVGAGKERLFIKLYSGRGDIDAAENLRALAALDGPEPRVPALVAHGASRRAVLMSRVKGKPFTGRIAAADASEYAAVGRALGALHASGVETRRAWTLAQELRSLRAAMGDVTLALPGLAPRIAAVRTELERRAQDLPAPASAPIHGNLFGDQILIRAGSVGLVDWDDLACGDPGYDVGRLLAHVLYEAERSEAPPAAIAAALASLLEAYEERAPWRLDRDVLAVHVACALLLRAKISGLRALEEGWPERVARSVAAAEDVLGARRSPYLPASFQRA